jgi:hypothetical protein
MFCLRSETKLTKCTVINWIFYFIVEFVLLKYNEAVTHCGSSGSKFVFNQILANKTRAFEVPYIYVTFTVWRLLVDKSWIK